LVHATKVLIILTVLCLPFVVTCFFNSAHAEPQISPRVNHMQSTGLPIATSESAIQKTMLPAKYDQQLGMTFCEDFSSLAYNVTAVDQTDPYGYGPAYLLNGLSNEGYWYQVGISYNWPYSGINGYSQGFAFNFQVFAPNQTAVYPRNGGGGLQPFFGEVNPGDTILLTLSFYGDNVIMYAQDWNTDAYSLQIFSAQGAYYFVGSPYAPSNNNGFFTGLMTEWYHAEPYYQAHSKVTYSNYDFELAAAWMWIDEYDPYNYSWTGAYMSTTAGPTIFTQTPKQIHTFTFAGLTQTCNAYEFNTGTIIPTQTTITLIPDNRAALLSASNQFTLWYTLNGRQHTTYAKDGAKTLTSDSNTSIILSPTSNGSSSNEQWVLNSNGTTVAVPSGSTTILVYYNILLQQVSYTTSDLTTPINLPITYYSAPETASSQRTQTRKDQLIPASTYLPIMPTRGSQVTLSESIKINSKEQYKTTTNTTWTIDIANQIPTQIIYQHQYLLSFGGAQLNWQWINSETTTQIKIPAISNRTEGTGQRLASYTIDQTAPIIIQPTTETVTIPVYMNSPHEITINYAKQLQVTLDNSVANNLAYITPPTINQDPYWYDQGTQVNLVLNPVSNRNAGVGTRLQTCTVNGAIINIETATPISILNLSAIVSPQKINANTLQQYQITAPTGNLAYITPPTLPGDAGWYDKDSPIVVTYNYSWNQTYEKSRTNAVSYTLNHDQTTPLERSANGTFQIQLTLTKPQNITVTSLTQNALTITGGFNIKPSQASPTNDNFYDSETTLTLNTDSNGKPSTTSTQQTIQSYTLNGQETTFNNTKTKTLTTSPITLNKPQDITFNSQTQTQTITIDQTAFFALIAIAAAASITALILFAKRRPSKTH
jgi:hypothetical protein